MTNKLIVRLSNEIGNQMFMYASSLAISKKLNRTLFIDDETAFRSKKNISKYALQNFKITSNIANNNFKFLGLKGYIARKILKKLNFFLKEKIFFIEPKNKEKITQYTSEVFSLNFSNNVFLEGYFESEKYFTDIKELIAKEFTFINEDLFKKSEFYENLIKKDTVSICLRQNRFIEGNNRNKPKNVTLSDKFKNEQILFINKSINYLKKKIENPSFYLWSNDLKNVDMSLFDSKIIKILHKQDFLPDCDKRALDLFLISQCNHHIVIPSSFNWWGAWLSNKDNKLICRPDDKFFSVFKINNQDFWPSEWEVIS